MYQALLTRKYLTSKIVPLVGVFAVMLCSAMVLIVWSIMGGFLTMLLAMGREMEGDVTIAWPTVGFVQYEDLVKRLEADPMVEAACPIIETFGILALPDGRKPVVQIRGVDPRYANVTAYAKSLWWKPIDEPLRKDKKKQDLRLNPDFRPGLQEAYEDGLSFKVFDRDKQVERPAIVLGIEVSDYSQRQPEGFYRPAGSVGRRLPKGGYEWSDGFLPGQSVTLTVLPLTENTRDLGIVQSTLPVANEFKTGVYESDNKTVLVELGELQRMLKMDAWKRLKQAPGGGGEYDITIDENGREVTTPRQIMGEEPARVTTVMVKGKAEVTPEELRERCEAIWGQFAAAFPGQVPSVQDMKDSRTIATFEMQRATFIGAVKQETALVLFLLIVISAVAAALILSIFWAMVSEKTRDIGTLRAVGAGQWGVAWLWLRYGMVIGLVGAALGLAMAYAIVMNINPIHEWMVAALDVSLWDPKVYYFATIPSVVEPKRAAIVATGAIVFSLIGALIPAVRAALMDPVKALRFE